MLKDYIVFDQRQQIKKPGQNELYEPNIVKVGVVKAHTSAEAIQIAKDQKLSLWPMVTNTEIERMHDRFTQRQGRQYNGNDSDRRGPRR